jgi:hypothetical protein
MLDSGTELDDSIDDDEDFRVLGFELQTMRLLRKERLRIESVCCEVSSV